MTARFDWHSVAGAALRGETPLVRFGATPATVARAAKQPIYLATPYSKVTLDQVGAWSRAFSSVAAFDAAAEVRRLKAFGVAAFSPIVQADAIVQGCIAIRGEFDKHHPLDAAGWMRWCQPFLNVCAAVVVPEIAGWDQSDGIKAEVAFAIDHGIPVFVYWRGSDGI